MIAGDFAPGFALRMAYKDIGLALDAAHDEGLQLPITTALEGRWREAIADGHADEDVSSVIAEAAARNIPRASTNAFAGQRLNGGGA